MRVSILAIAFILMGILSSCDNRKDPFWLKDKCPIVLIKRMNDTEYQKVINDSNKIGLTYIVNVKYTIDENVPIERNKTFSNDSINLVDKLFYIHNKNIGNCYYSLKLTDSYGKSDSAVLNIYSFKNLPPYCTFTVNKKTDVDPLQITINASQSYDLDRRWGGKIIKYEYNINGLILKNSIDSINYIFGSKGQKKISLRVLDNDTVWSETITKFINL